MCSKMMCSEAYEYCVLNPCVDPLFNGKPIKVEPCRPFFVDEDQELIDDCLDIGRVKLGSVHILGVLDSCSCDRTQKLVDSC